MEMLFIFNLTIEYWGKKVLLLSTSLYVKFRFTFLSHKFWVLAKASWCKKNWPKATHSTTALLYMNFAVKNSDDLFNF